MLQILCILTLGLCFTNAIAFVASTNSGSDDFVSRGRKLFGDKCETTQECGFLGSICDSKTKSCRCVDKLPVTNYVDKCAEAASVNENCSFNEQCEAFNFLTACRDGRCTCRFELSPVLNKDGIIECRVGEAETSQTTEVNPTNDHITFWAWLNLLIANAPINGSSIAKVFLIY